MSSEKQTSPVKHIEFQDASHINITEDSTFREGNERMIGVRTSSEEDEKLHRVQKQFPPIPVKMVALPVFLLLAGIFLVIAGFQAYSADEGGLKVASFMILGILISIPGCFYTFQIIQAYNADTPEEREDILNDIPI